MITETASHGQGDLAALRFDAPTPPVLVPIRHLGPGDKPQLLAHFLALDPGDRYLRFGYAAGDAQIRAYVDGIDFARDEIFGVFNRRLELIGVAHIAVPPPHDGREAEFGVSVLPSGRGRGIGSRLFQRAAIHARNRGIEFLAMQCLSQNGPMLHIARRAGMELHAEGTETEARLRIPQRSMMSHLDEWVEDATGQIDFLLKLGMRRPDPVAAPREPHQPRQAHAASETTRKTSAAP